MKDILIKPKQNKKNIIYRERVSQSQTLNEQSLSWIEMANKTKTNERNS